MHKSELTIYTPDSSMRHPFRLILKMFQDVYNGRELALRLAIRDISAQYRQAALGLMWAFILPVANTVTWLFLSGSGIISVGETELPYAAYVFSGTMLWAIFMDAVNAPLQQTTSAKSILTKIKLPYEALIISGIYKTLFNAAIKIAVVLGGLAILGIIPGSNILLLPLGILSLILAGTVIGLLLTPIGTLYSDIAKSLPLLMQFLMYLSPVVFPMPSNKIILAVFEWNPITPLILTARDWMTGMSPEYLGYFIFVNIILFVLLIITWMIYRVAMPILIERMSS